MLNEIITIAFLIYDRLEEEEIKEILESMSEEDKSISHSKILSIEI